MKEILYESKDVLVYGRPEVDDDIVYFSIIKDENIFQDEADALVNPVNCVGSMGKGLAAQFRSKYISNFQSYSRACKKGELQPGRLWVTKEDDSLWIINFPTKAHWRDGSKQTYVESGLTSLVSFCAQYNLHSIAIPAIGCGLGGLSWNIVKDLVFDYFRESTTKVRLYSPKSSNTWR